MCANNAPGEDKSLKVSLQYMGKYLHTCNCVFLVFLISCKNAEYRGICQNVDAINKSQDFSYDYLRFFTAFKQNEQKLTTHLCFGVINVLRLLLISQRLSAAS